MSPEVQVALVSGVFLLLAALVSAVVPHLRRQSKDLAEVKHQVKNSHGTNLRDDLDLIRDEMRRGFHWLHEEIALERRERVDLAERLEKKK